MWCHLKCLMKIEWWTLHNDLTSLATWQNFSALSSIRWMRLNDDDSHLDVLSRPLI